MNNKILLLKEKMKSLRNIVRIILIKYSLQGFAALAITAIGVYVFQKKLSIEYSNVVLTSDINIIIDFFIKDLLFIALSISYIVYTTSYKLTLSYWEKVKLLPYRKENIYYFYLIISFVISNLLIYIPVSIILYSSKSRLYHIIYIFLIITCTSLGFLTIKIFIHKVLSQASHKIKYDFGNLIAIILIFILQILIYEKVNLDFNIRCFVVIFLPLLLGISGILITRNKSLTFWNKAQISNLKLGNNYKINLPFYNYIDILLIEITRNYDIYFKFIFIQFTLVLLGRNLLSMAGDEMFYMNIATLAGITIGLYNSYLDTYKLLPIKDGVHLLLRGVISFVLVNIMFLITWITIKNPFIINGYLNVIFLSSIMFLIVYLIKLPLVYNKKENTLFYLMNYGIVTIYNIFTRLIKSIINDTINMEFHEVYITGLLLICLVSIIILKLKESENETIYRY